jgi:hypothetical protein
LSKGKDWEDIFRQTSLGRLRTAQGEWMKKKPSQTLEAVSKIKNGLRALFSSSACFFIAGKGVKNLSALSLPNHRQRLFLFVLSLSKQERTLHLSSLTLQMVFQFMPFDRLPSTSSGQAGRTD